MSLNFPSTPSANATYSFNNKTWTYTGNAWKLSTSTLSTSVVAEGTNLYFSNARVYSNVVTLGYITTSALSGYATNTQLASYATNTQLASYATNAQLASYATNAQLAFYATTSNLDHKANIADLKTANVAELTNLYFTNVPATAAIIYTTLSNITVAGNVTAGNISIATGGVLTFADGSRQTTSPGTLLNIITRTSNVGVSLQNKTISVQGRSANTTVAIT